MENAAVKVDRYSIYNHMINNTGIGNMRSSTGSTQDMNLTRSDEDGEQVLLLWNDRWHILRRFCCIFIVSIVSKCLLLCQMNCTAFAMETSLAMTSLLDQTTNPGTTRYSGWKGASDYDCNPSPSSSLVRIINSSDGLLLMVIVIAMVVVSHAIGDLCSWLEEMLIRDEESLFIPSSRPVVVVATGVPKFGARLQSNALRQCYTRLSGEAA